MTRKKGFGSDSTPDRHRVVLGRDSAAGMDFQSLVKNYQELHKEVQSKRRKLRAMNKKKIKITAEIRFLRKRYEYLVKGKSQMKQPTHPKTFFHHADHQNEAILLPPHSVFGPTRTRHKTGLESAPNRSSSTVLESSREGLSDAGHRDILEEEEEASNRAPPPPPLFDLNQTIAEDDGGRMSSSPSESKSVQCRNVGEGGPAAAAAAAASRVGKRKISWHDPVAVRV